MLECFRSWGAILTTTTTTAILQQFQLKRPTSIELEGYGTNCAVVLHRELPQPNSRPRWASRALAAPR